MQASLWCTKGVESLFSARARKVRGRAQNFVVEHNMFALEHKMCALARFRSCSSTNISCSDMTEFVLEHKYFVLEQELDYARAQHFVLEQKLDRARARSSCSSTNILCSSTKVCARAQNICARAEIQTFDPFGTPYFTCYCSYADPDQLYCSFVAIRPNAVIAVRL